MKAVEYGDVYDTLHDHFHRCGIGDNGDEDYEILVRLCAAAVLSGTTANVLGKDARYQTWSSIRDLLDGCNMEEVGVMEVVRNAVQYAAKELGVALDAD